MPVRKFHSDKEAVRQLAEGKSEAFTYLYDSYAEKVHYFALGFLRSGEDAGNLTQEVFLKVWENRKRLDPGQSFNAYLFTVARNTIFNMHRKKLNEIAYLEHLEASTSLRDSETERLVDFRELRERLDRCVDQLPPRQKEVFSLSRTDGLSHREISQRMGIAEKTIAAHIRLALQSLRRCLSME